MSDIFLSYARKDHVIAGHVAKHLQEEGLEVFWDREIPVGKTWEIYIEENLSKARCVVVLWSSSSVASDWVRAEAAAAVDRGVLAPATIDATRPPLRFRTIQTADLAGWGGRREHVGLANLTAAVHMLMNFGREPLVDSRRPDQIRGSEKPIAIAEVETGPNRGRSITLTEGMTSVTIGRSRDCDFVLDDHYISRSHCRLEVQPMERGSRAGGEYGFALIDSGSSAGTLVNGERVELADLQSGDRFQIGAVRFIFRVLEEGAA
jgi:hypothetical protein